MRAWRWQVAARAVQSNGRCGGARAANGTGSSPAAAGRSRCARILPISTGSSMLASTLSLPPHRRQVSISIANTRFSRCAQLCPGQRSVLWSSRSGGLGLWRRAAAAARRSDGGAPRAVGSEHSVIAREMRARRRHQGSETGEEVERFEENVSRAVPVRRLQPIVHLAVRGKLEPLD